MSVLKKLVITASLMFLTTALFADVEKTKPTEPAKAPVAAKDVEKVKGEKADKIASNKAPEAKKSKKAIRKKKCPKSTRSRLRRRAC